LFARMTPKIRDIVKRYPNDDILIVSHGAALCAEIRYLQGIPLEKIRAKGGLANTSTTILQTVDDNQKFKCLVWNKTDYLKSDLGATYVGLSGCEVMDNNIKNKAVALITDLIQKIDYSPDDAQAYYNLGVALNDAHSAEQAEELLKKALNIFAYSKEKSSIMYYGLGNVYYTNSMYDKAIVEFKKIQSEKLKQDSMLMMAQAY